MIEVKNITGRDIKRIIDVFTPLIGELIKNSEGKKNDDKKHVNPYGPENRNNESRRKRGGKLPPGWKEVLAPAGNTFYFNTKTGTTELDPPEMCVSDTPFSEFKGQPSALDIFQRMPPNFYETLDKAFETAAFTKVDDIRKISHEKVESLVANGTLNSLGISKEEAEVLFSYTYEAEPHEQSPYCIMNTVLAERDDNKVRNHRGYILHLLKALRKLKPVPTAGTTLYRGIDGKYLKFDDGHYKVDNVLTWPAFTSTTTKESVMYDQFLKRAAQPIIFEIHGSFVGYNITLFSRFPNEEEILLEPETTFRVKSIENDAKNPKAKRIVIDVQQTPLMIKEAVDNFERNEWNLYHPQKQQINYNFVNNLSQSFNYNKGWIQQPNNSFSSYQQNMNNNGGQFTNNFNNGYGGQQQFNNYNNNENKFGQTSLNQSYKGNYY